MKVNILQFLIAAIFCCGQLFCQETEEIDFVITVDERVMNTVQGLSLKFADDESSIIINPQYHPGNLTFKQSEFNNLMSGENEILWLRFYTIKDEESTTDYSIKIHRDWFKERFIVLGIFNLDKRKYRKQRKPIEPNMKYSVSIDFGHYSIMDLNNQVDPVVVKYH